MDRRVADEGVKTMFRLFLRDALVAGGLLILLACAAAVLGLPAIAPGPAAPWSLELARIAAAPLLVARDGALLVFGLAVLAGLLRLALSGLRLSGRDYPAAAHLAEALASRLARRAGALAGVLLTMLQGMGLARASGPTRHVSGTSLAPRAALVYHPDASPLPSTSARPSRPGTPRHRKARPGVRGLRRRVGLALRYTVQPDDTMDEVAARFGLPDWRPIMRATRGLPQTVGGPITDPNLIYPGQVLHIPLPCPALRVAGDRVLYVVQREDTLSGIAARFLGDWRAYREIGDLNRGVHQPDGGALENDNLIQPGWVLRLPQEDVTSRPDATSVTRRMIVADLRPLRLRRGLHPRRPARHPAHATAQPAPAQQAQHARRQTHSTRHVATRGRVHPRLHHGKRLRPRPPHRVDKAPHRVVTRRPVLCALPAHAAPPAARHGTPGRGSVRRPLIPRRGAPAQLRPIGPTAPRPIRGSGPARPLIHVPDLGRDLPVAFVLGFLTVATAVAASRRRARRRGRRAPGSARPWGRRLHALAPSVQRTLRATLNGVEGSLARALRRTPVSASGGPRAARVMVALERAGEEAGIPYSLAGATRLLVESAETIELVVEAPRLAAAQVADAVRRLGTALGVPVTAASCTERDGMPVVTLTIKSAGLATAATGQPHPTPLLVPLGATASGAVVHLHLGRTGGLLVAGGGQSLVATLLASTVYQAAPDALRLLVASDDDELRKALPQLDHLDAPPADARDPHAVANIVAQAHTLVLERYERSGASGTARPGARPTPPVPCLLVLAGIEKLGDETLDRLDAVAHTGPVCGVHLIATTSDPAALAASGMLTLFRTRLARRLAPADNQLVCPDADVSALGPQDVLLYGLGAQQQLRAFSLTPPEVREVCATVAASGLPVLPTAGIAVGPPALAPPTLQPAPAVPEAELKEPPPQDTAADEIAVRLLLDAAQEVADAREETGEAPVAAASGATICATGPPVRLEILGGIAIHVHGQPINILPRERNLLAALAIMGPRPVRRGDLIEALFADDEDGGNTLSHTLSDLRAALREGGLRREQAKDLVLKSSGGYSLHPDLAEVDLWRFDALLREAESLDETAAGPVLADAFALYHGPLCEGEALEFLEEHGYRWMRRVPPALYILADYYREAGDLKIALHWARRLLADEPCDAHTNQLVMNLLAELRDAEGLDAHVQEMREQYAAYKQAVDAYSLRLHDQLRRKLKSDSESKAG